MTLPDRLILDRLAPIIHTDAAAFAFPGGRPAGLPGDVATLRVRIDDRGQASEAVLASEPPVLEASPVDTSGTIPFAFEASTGLWMVDFELSESLESGTYPLVIKDVVDLAGNAASGVVVLVVAADAPLVDPESVWFPVDMPTTAHLEWRTVTDDPIDVDESEVRFGASPENLNRTAPVSQVAASPPMYRAAFPDLALNRFPLPVRQQLERLQSGAFVEEATDPEPDFIYALRVDADVIGLDLNTGGIVWRFPVDGQRSDHMAMSPDGSRVAVSASTGNVVHILDTFTGQELGRFPSGDSPHENNYSSDGQRIFHASIGAVYTPADQPLFDSTKGDRRFQIVDTKALSYAETFIIRGLNQLPLSFRPRTD